jgi:hypothetical protein
MEEMVQKQTFAKMGDCCMMDTALLTSRKTDVLLGNYLETVLSHLLLTPVSSSRTIPFLWSFLFTESTSKYLS